MAPSIGDSSMAARPGMKALAALAALPIAGTALGAGLGAAVSKKGQRKRGALEGGVTGLLTGGLVSGTGLAVLFARARQTKTNPGPPPAEINPESGEEAPGDAVLGMSADLGAGPKPDTPNIDPHMPDYDLREYMAGQPSTGGEDEVQAAMEASGFPGYGPYEPKGSLLHQLGLALANTGRAAKSQAGEVSDDLVKYVQENYESLLPAATALGGAGAGALIRGKGQRARGALEGGAVGLAAGALTPSAQRALEAYRLQRARTTGQKRAADGPLPTRG